MFRPVAQDCCLPDNELKITEFWKQNSIFEKSVQKNKGKESFVFFDGPPTSNGRPHIGHVLTRAIKDLIPRYKTMKGYYVARKAGWDTHGLPVELEVEKELGFKNKTDIEHYGIQSFIEHCKTSVWKYKQEWESLSDRVGFWADFENPYITYTDNYIESVWWAISQFDKKGLLYRGHKIVPYCPRCGTALSSHEVAQGYKDVTEDTIFVKASVKGRTNTYFLVWTTTPWTLFSNVALCVNPEADYAEVVCEGNTYILAHKLVESLLKDKQYTVGKVCKGKELQKIEYEPIFDCAKNLDKKAFYVVCDDYVTTQDGTGIVHIAPAFGEDDARLGKNYDLPLVQFVNEQGQFTKEVQGFAAKDAISSNPQIILQLKEQGKLFKRQKHTHSYPFCWRCDTPLLYFAKKTWFLKMSALRDQLVQNNRSVYWMPDNFKEGRMGSFLENVIDWGISRDRYWGTPLPAWVCDNCNKHIVVGSKQELAQLSGQTPHELHKPYIDEITIKCACGGTAHRTPEVIDCWFDSGSMPFAQHHYPFENKEVFEEQFPANFIAEGSDQSRGWFYTLQAISTAIFGKSPFKSCIALGMVNDEHGRKMSKHLGNGVDSWKIFASQGADAVRWYFYYASAPWLSTSFSESSVEEAKRKFIGTLQNVYSFFVTYANIEKFDQNTATLNGVQLELMDKWILSKLSTLIDNVDELLAKYKIFEAARALFDFVDALSNWYVRRCRDRFWGTKGQSSCNSALQTLYAVLLNLSKLCAPFIPFFSEEMYQNLTSNVANAPISVHLCEYPNAKAFQKDAKLEQQMSLIYDAVVAGRVARNNENIKNRQPLSKIFVSLGNPDLTLSAEMKQIIGQELNIDEVVLASGSDDFVSYVIKPQLKTLGAKYGKNLPIIRDFLAANSTAQLINSLKQGAKTFEERGVQFTLSIDDILVSTVGKQGYCSATENGITVFIETTLTQELIVRGNARELVSKIQRFRKDINLNIEDRIDLFISLKQGDLQLSEQLFDYVKTDVLAKSITNSTGGEFTCEAEVNNSIVIIGISKV